MYSKIYAQSGWWYTYPSEKYEFVSWDYDIPNRWKVMKFMFQTTNQIGIHWGISGEYQQHLGYLMIFAGLTNIFQVL